MGVNIHFDAVWQKAREADILGSMGSVRHVLDNAVTENFFSALQIELFDTKKVWESSAELRTAISEYIEVFYNRQRRYSSLQHMTPYKFESQSSQWLAACA